MGDESYGEDRLLGEIRARMKKRLSDPRDVNAIAGAGFSGAELDRLEELCRCAVRTFNSIGALPPCPPTMRGRLGRSAVRLVRRLLEWYTPQIVAFNSVMVDLVRAQTAAIAGLRTTLEQSRHEAAQEHADILQCLSAIDRLDAEVIRLRDLAPESCDPVNSGDCGPGGFSEKARVYGTSANVEVSG